MTERTTREELTGLMQPVIAAMESQASSCATDQDLHEAVRNAHWLNLVAVRVLGVATVSYAHQGDIPGPPRGSFGKRASVLLDTQEFGDPDVSDGLLQAVRLQRSAMFACGSLAKEIESLPEQ